MQAVYFSSVSESTHRFVQKLDVVAHRIPVMTAEGPLEVTEPYVLITPTYGAGRGDAVPKQVVKFLNNPENRRLIRGVVGAGNRNFGQKFGAAADVVSGKCNVPVLHKFEILGETTDVSYVQRELERIARDSD